MSKISDHITLKEGIENIPGEYELTNMVGIAENVFEPLRDWVDGPIKINSFYRSPELNKAMGGSSKSQHCQGRAIDIDDVYGHKTNAEMYNYIKNNLDFDQLIWEFGTDDNPDWVHVSYVSVDENRRRCLKAERKKGKTVYSII